MCLNFLIQYIQKKISLGCVTIRKPLHEKCFINLIGNTQRH